MSRDKVIFIGGNGSGSGDVTGQASSIDSEIALFSGTTGKVIKRSSGTGIVKETAGVKTNIIPGTGVETFLATPTLANLNTVVSDDNVAGLAAANTFTGQNTNNLVPIVPDTDLGTNFASGTVLTLQTTYRATLSSAKTLTFSGSPTEGSTTSVRVTCTTAAVLTIPSCKRAGAANTAITSISVPTGVHSLVWQYIGAEYVLYDTVNNEVKHFAIAFDPKAVCDGAVDRLFLMTVGDHAPNGLVVTAWKLSFEADPTTEVDLDLKRADAFIGVANSAVMDVLDTTSGVSSESTTANINSGAAVANGKIIYLEFGTTYTETTHQLIFEMWYYPVN